MTPYRIPAMLKLGTVRADIRRDSEYRAHVIAEFRTKSDDAHRRLDQLEALLDETRHELDRTRVQLRSLRIIACLYMLAATWVAFFWRM